MELQSSLKRRSVLQGQIHKLINGINLRFNELNIQEIDIKISRLENLNDRVQETLDSIQMLSEDDSDDIRGDIEDEVDTMLARLQAQRKMFTVGEGPTQDPGQGPCQHSVDTNITFVGLQPDEKITNFTRRFDTYISLRNIKDSKIKVLTLMNSLSPDIHQKMYDLCSPDKPLDMSYEDLTQLLSIHLEPKPSTWVLQNKFINRIQQSEETVSQYSVELKRLAADCQFTCDCGKSVSDLFLSLQFLRGLKDEYIKTQILQERGKRKFKELVDTAVLLELSKTDSKSLSSTPKGDGTVFQVRSAGRSNDSRGTSVLSRGHCYRCGNTLHRANKCKFIDSKCHNCGKIGHLKKVCLSKKTDIVNHQVDEGNSSGSEKETHEMFVMSTRVNDKFEVCVFLEGKKVAMELDTGAALTSMSYNYFKQLGIPNKIFKTGVEMKTYTGEIVRPKGVAYVKGCYKGQNFCGRLFVIDQDVDPIFGREWLREVKLDWAALKSVKTTTKDLNLDDLLTEFKDVFEEGVGCVPNVKGHLQLKEGSRPIYFKPRQVPYALKDKVSKELMRLETNDIITRVDYSDWGTPVVPVLKPNGEVRLCADYKCTLNKCIIDEHYPIPRIEDIFTQMNGGRFFTTLDIRQAYLNMEMDEESALLQTISTHIGLFKVNRLMFGVKVAPSIWQKHMDKILQDKKGVQCFYDDLIIQGETLEEAYERLSEVLQIMRDNNLRLNKEKCKFFQKSINYLGHTIDEQGLHKTKEKTQALLSTKRPSNVVELRTFLGFANYYNKFIPHLATMLNPLYKLLKKNTQFEWTQECNAAFEKVKLEITSDKVLTHYSPKLRLVLATDASPVGLGAVLSHRYENGVERPIAFASRSLTKSELRYSQIDKEATAIYWGLKKFMPYCYGRKITIITDHKPLISIFHPTKTLPTISALRIFNYAHFLSGFDYNIEYRGTKEHADADYFSRFPMTIDSSRVNSTDDHAKFQINQISVMPVTKAQIAEETKEDDYLKPILQAMESGSSVEKFGYHDNELSLQDGCLFKGTRVLIPARLRKRVLDEIHTGHLGMTKMKTLARFHCYWKNIDQHIEDLARQCRSCCMKRNNPAKVALHPWEEATGPWQRIHVDFAEPTAGKYYFIIVDAYSKWVEVIPTKCTTSEWCIKKLMVLFSTFGLPQVVVTDNGAQFTSRPFITFLENHVISHKRTAPFHPATNGQAERFVQTVKNSLAAMRDDCGDEHDKICMMLTQLRRAPNSTGSNAYQLMFNRPIRTKLDLLNEKTLPNEIHTNFPSARNFKVGDRVQARSYKSKRVKWEFGRITQKEGVLHYCIKMDNGEVWRRHVNQILATKFEGED